jgi:tetratricopeptide (TPR) repeat protein
MDPEIRDFYRDVFGPGEFELEIQDGVNLLTAASVEAEVRSGTQMLGLNLEKLVLQGSNLKNFDAEELGQAKRDGKLLKAMGREAELRARLTDLKIKGLPKEFQIRDLALLVTGQPTVGLEFFMTVGTGNDQRDFRCQAKFMMANQQNQGLQGVSISATSDVDQPWRNALGLKGLEMRDLKMEIRYERTGAAAPPTVLIGVGGKMKFAEKFVEVVGGVQSKAGILVGFFRGSINSINRDDLVAVINDAHALASNQDRKRIDARSLPDFELRDATFNFAPLGGSEELGIESGIGLEGELVLFGSPVGQADVLGDSNQPLVRLTANVNRFRIADIELHDTKLDVRMASDASSYFRFKGGARVMDIEATAEAELSVDKTFVHMTGKVANKFEADLMYRTPSLDNPVWEFEAGFKDDFSRQLGARAATDIRAWAESTKRDYDKASRDIDIAKREVSRINNDIANMRNKVETERKAHRAAVNKAQADVQKINSDIANMRRQVQGERNRHLNAIKTAEAKVQQLQRSIDARRNAVKAQRSRDLDVHKRELDAAKRNYDAAQRDFKSAGSAWKKEKNPIKKLKKGITKDAKGVARDARKGVYYAAKKKYDVAKAALDRIPVDADPQIVGLMASKKSAEFALQQTRQAYQRVTRGLSIDADPRIAGLFATRETANLALQAAQRAFDLAHRLPVDADPRVAGLFVARDSALTALDAAKLAVNVSGDTIQLATEVLAQTAEGKIVAVESARLRGKLSAFDSGSKVEFAARVRLLDKPQTVRLAVSANDLKDGNVFAMVAKKLIPIK